MVIIMVMDLEMIYHQKNSMYDLSNINGSGREQEIKMELILIVNLNHL